VCSAVFPANYAFAFNPQPIGALNGVAWWAVMMFVFAAGLKLDLGDAWKTWRETAITAGCALIVPSPAGRGGGSRVAALCQPR